MSDESKVESAIADEPINANSLPNPKGEGIDLEKYVPKETFEELESSLEEKTKRNEEIEKWLEEISPLMEKLDSQPEVVKAILEGKITPNLIQAISEGKVSLTEAKTVTEAHKEVKEDLGKKYTDMSPEKIEQLVEAKASEMVAKSESKLEKILSDERQLRELQDKITSFIGETPDFADFAQSIVAWFNDHPDQTDIEVAYATVKGKALLDAQKKAINERAGESAKEIAANATGGGSMATGNLNDKDVIDSFISFRRNPNSL